MIITGTHIAYYFICARKLWFFCKGIQCEHESDAVRLGKHIHENSYNRNEKEIAIDGVIVVDWIDHEQKIVHEVKKSDKMEESHIWQLKYYLWYLRNKGLSLNAEVYTGELNYPKLNKIKEVTLSDKDIITIEKTILPNIENIVQLKKSPAVVAWKVCKSCSYNEFCYG